MKQGIQNINYDYIRGLVAGGSGTFTFTTAYSGNRKRMIPSFQLRMSVKNKRLLEGVKDALGLKNNIYTYQYSGKDGYKRRPFAMLIVREFGSLKNVIIPLFYGQLISNKGEQFDKWLERIGSDPSVRQSYKLLYRLHKSGYFKRELSPNGLFRKFLG